MKKHHISQLHLVNLHVNTSDSAFIDSYEDVKAIMNISYGQKDQHKTLFYQISIEEKGRRIYSLKCEFHYICDHVYDEKNMVLQAVDLVSPRIEEIISMITLQVYPKSN